MRHALAALLFAAASAGPAIAQDVPEITVRPLDDGRGGGTAYVGPYGRDLPGVSMFSGRAVPGTTPLFADGGVKIPSRQKIPAEYTHQDPLPPLDAWHGTLSPGFPF
jgi:hypothetical protein